MINFSEIGQFCLNNWELLSIPVVAAVVGWFTNWIALEMTFKPLEFWGVELPIKIIGVGPKDSFPRIGWQGIIPSKAGFMAGKAVDLITTKLMDVQEQFARIDPKVVALEMEPTIERLSRRIIDECMQEHMPAAWAMLPKGAKAHIYEKAAEEFPQVVEDIMTDIKHNISELFDLRGMVIENLTNNKNLLNRIFQEVGEKEFKFIEYSGFYFGFLFGLPQMLLWYYVQDYWWAWVTLPLGGVLVGYLTNWLALKLIFEPEQPLNILGFKFQGLFIKRQKEVAAAYSKIVAENILTPEQIFHTILNGPSSDKLVNIVHKNVSEGVNKTAGFGSSLIIFAASTRTYEQIKVSATERFMEELPLRIKMIFGYAGEAMNLENTLKNKMAGLPAQDFVSFLRPVFQEDEWKLILTGAVLGGIAGAFQILIM